MGEQDAGASVARGIGNDCAEGEGRAALIAIMTRDVKAIRAAVHVCHPQALPCWIGLGEAAGEEAGCSIGSVQSHRLFGTLMAHPA